MKELALRHKDAVKSAEQRQIEKQLKFVGNVFIRPNQRCYEYNLETKEILEAEMEVFINLFAMGVKIDIYNGVTTGQPRLERKVVTKENCIYIVAINKENAMRKINKQRK